jgi:hypothetical protein
MARAWKSRHTPRPTSLTAIAKTYHGCATAFAASLGISLAEALKAYHGPITAIFIEACRQEIRVPAGVTLPPLVKASVASPNGQVPMGTTAVPATPARPLPAESTVGTSPPVNGHRHIPAADRLTQDQARALKRLAQQAFGYEAGERRLRHDLGFEVDERLTLRHLAAHVTTAQHARLREAYEAALRQGVEADAP